MRKLPKVAILLFLCHILKERKKKEVSDEVDFLHTDDDEIFLQIDTKIFDGDGGACLNFPNSKFAISLQYLKKEVRDEYDEYSAWQEILFGVHQGSILGPLLFNIHMCNLFFVAKSIDIASYADDTTLSKIWICY